MRKIDIYIGTKDNNKKLCSCLCNKTNLPFRINDELGAIERNIVSYNIFNIIYDINNIVNNKNELYQIMKKEQIYIEDNGFFAHMNKNSLYKDNISFIFEIKENF